MPPGQFHKVHTVSEEPSCYMYIYINTTYVEIMEKVDTVEKTMSEKNISAGELISVIILKMKSVLVWMLVNGYFYIKYMFHLCFGILHF